MFNDCRHNDPLYQKFRCSETSIIYNKFKEKGLSKLQLDNWKKYIPIIYPWDLEYDILRQNVNKRFVVFPMAIVMCSSKKHVDFAFNICLKYDIKPCIRSGSHCYEPYSLSNGIIIDQSKRTKSRVDIENKLVTIEPGCLNGPTADILKEYDLAIPAGTCASVGIVGLTLGGGFGFLGRKFGLTCDNLVNFELILANGNTICVNNSNYPDLFYAHKGGGGGNFGIVTSLTYKVHEVKDVIIFELWWDCDDLENALSNWISWVPDSNNNITTEFNIYAMNDSNKKPYPILITGLYIGSCKSTLKKYIKSFLELKPKLTKTIKTTYINSVKHFTYSNYPPPFFKNKSTFIYKQLPKQIYSVIKKYMKQASSDDRFEMNSLCGEYSNVKSNNTAFVHRNAIAWVHWICRWNKDNEQEKRLEWVNNFYNEFIKIAGNSVCGAYVNCPDSKLSNWPELYYGSNLEKLIDIKKKYDPNKIFEFEQGLSNLY